MQPKKKECARQRILKGRGTENKKSYEKISIGNSKKPAIPRRKSDPSPKEGKAQIEEKSLWLFAGGLLLSGTKCDGGNLETGSDEKWWGVA